MTTNLADLLADVDRVARDTIAPGAARIDAQSEFPRAAIDALAGVGALGVLSSPDVGGLGLGLSAAAEVVQRVAQACGSTAMVLTMHLCGTAVLEAFAPVAVRRDAASGKHLSTLAFSEAGSRSMFWAPTSTATRTADGIALDAKKSWVTSAHHATAYVWSSRPIAGDGPSTLWLVPRDAAGVAVAAGFDGLGLRGNDSCPVTATKAVVPESAMLGSDGGGFDVMMGVVLPNFQVLNAACSLGLMNAAIARTIAHATGTKFEHTGAALADSPVTRGHISRMKLMTDQVATLVADTTAALAQGRADASLRVLQTKAAAGETANAVLDLAMRVCGGAAFRKEVGVDRYFRDARASAVMAPTLDALHEFMGRALCGMPLA
ncbi:MAG: acyl-CoA/acyl-ACP dehydrogenase [Nannocystaceae bacterium]|nr:acyl-CoA/acyl-ACP dehydrogenase [Nannocystaceae bacterium]